ncbi:hypothetical protein [Ulvibacter antarcticus]|uniref:Uncharacterized protein n=1 Tax=Ulvibacter antarcticus TaxID=442714 RepID=A0A3L9YXT1_9FLAO|nr:hypothetical protein [Ulvibacter antarcticus]RMA64637.1 hypothetical protein BXY75_1515 [Ulvibacter antarcticus]
MNNRRKIIVVLFLLVVGGYFAYNYMYKDHRDISTEEPSLEIAGTYLLERFKTGNGEDLLNRTITVTGKVTQVEGEAVTIDFSVYCSMASETAVTATNKEVRIKGRCIGYDDLFELVKLDQCTIVK